MVECACQPGYAGHGRALHVEDSMKQVFLGGPAGVVVEDVPVPALGPHELLVRTSRSLISTGTEGAGVVSAARKSRSPLQRVADDPALVAKAFRRLLSDGARATAKAATGAGPSDLVSIGYSAAGTVLEVGAAVTGFEPGDLVACAGGGYANHAEFIVVPQNLTVHTPLGLSTDAAAFVTLGAIAMQGVRRAEVGLGDRIATVGLGLLGQIGTQIATAAGCRVLAMDLDAERVALASDLGASFGVVTRESDPVSAAMHFSDGVGLDAVILFAGTKSSALVNQAFEMTRERGRVIVVGDVGMDLERRTFYRREQDLLISRSYGPGRYDSEYEERGRDYPIAYVRWTENRNMQEFLSLVAEGKVRVDALVAGVYPVDSAADAYRTALSATGAAVATLLSYDDDSLEAGEDGAEHYPSAGRTVVLEKSGTTKTGTVEFGLIGSGAFARDITIPGVLGLQDARIAAVVSRKGPGAVSAARRARARYATSDVDEMLHDESIDAVIITTRHDSHAYLAERAARAGKHVLVEKPLGLSAEECRSVIDAVAESGVLCSVGFNRRFSPHVQHAMKALSGMSGPKMMLYRVNAGFKPSDHWVFDPVEGGGRIVGEACHFIDLLTYLSTAEPVKVWATSPRGMGAEYVPYDTMTIGLEFADGSIGQIVYAGNGDSSFPKERLEVFADKSVVCIDDYRITSVHGIPGLKNLETKASDKGHSACIESFAGAVLGRHPLRVNVHDGARGTIVALAAIEAARTGMPQVPAPSWL